MEINDIRDNDVDDVIALWRKCDLVKSHNDPYRDIELARAGENSTVLVGKENDCCIASVVVGHDGHRGCVYYVACDPGHANLGIGRLIMEAAEEWLKNRGVWKLNLMVRDTNTEVVGFYEAIGYVKEPRVVMSKRLGANKSLTGNRGDEHDLPL